MCYSFLNYLEENGEMRGNNAVFFQRLRLCIDWCFEMDVLCCPQGAANPTRARSGSCLQHNTIHLGAFPSLKTNIKEWELMSLYLCFSSKM